MKPRPRSAWTLALVVTAAAAAPAAPAHAQGVRGTALTTARYFELRPIRRDTVPRAQVDEAPDGTLRYNGVPVTCFDLVGCIFYRADDVQSAVALTQDVGVTAWGLGVQGLSVTALLRARMDAGGDFVWPHADNEFQAILAYAELNRGPLRGRLGRLRATSGLGFTGYDGANIRYDVLRGLELEAYGGRSLARGVQETHAEALRNTEEPVIPLGDTIAYLIGGAARAEPWPGTSFAVRYQREIWSDRAGLVSERAAAEFSTSQFDPLMVDAAIDYDFGFGHIGKAHATVRAPMRRVTLEATARRYIPYFELWTIWGYFSPVGYHEAEARATWRATPTLTTWLSGGWRRYEEANATVIFTVLDRDGARIAIGGAWRPSADVTIDASYRMDEGFGAFLSSGDASAYWQLSPRAGLGLDFTAFQQIEQFRVGEGVVFGGGASADVRVTDAIALTGGATIYRQSFANRPAITDWNQVRAWTSLRIGFGRDPGRIRRSGAQ